jgi:hypothetical protein
MVLDLDRALQLDDGVQFARKLAAVVLAWRGSGAKKNKQKPSSGRVSRTCVCVSE